jgi:ABC-type lipoprotein release transport system permease subunit
MSKIFHLKYVTVGTNESDTDFPLYVSGNSGAALDVSSSLCQPAQNEICLPKVIADELGVDVGDRIHLNSAAAVWEATISQILSDPIFGSPIMGVKLGIIDSSLYDQIVRNETESFQDSVLLYIWIHGENATSRAAAANNFINSNPSTWSAVFAYDSTFVAKAYTMIPNIITALILIVAIAVGIILYLTLSQIVSMTIRADWRISGILKSMGMSSRQLRKRLILRLAALTMLGALGGIVFVVFGVPFLAKTYLASNGLTFDGQPALWPAAPATIITISLVVITTAFRSRTLKHVSPKDAVSGQVGIRRAGKANLIRPLTTRFPEVGLALSDAQKSPSTHISLFIGTMTLTFLSSVLLALSSNFSSASFVSKVLGLNSYDVVIVRTGFLDRETSSYQFQAEIQGISDNLAPVEFFSSMQSVNIGTPQGTVVATVSELFPNSQELSDGELPTTANEVMLGNGLATSLGLHVGENIELHGGPGATKSYEVVGLYTTVNQTGLTLWMTDSGYRLLQPNYSPTSYAMSISTSSLKVTNELITSINESNIAVASDGLAPVRALIRTIQSTVETLAGLFVCTTIIVIVIVSLLTCATSVVAERRNLLVRITMGATKSSTRRSVAARFSLISTAGVLCGGLLAMFMGERLLAGVLASAGLSKVEFAVGFPILVASLAAICLISFVTAYLASRAVHHFSPKLLVSE